jgi:hypothetical protein
MPRWKYDLNSVVAALNKVVDSDPARKDQAASDGLGGRYIRHGCPCCLVGEILVELGASLGTLKGLDRDGQAIDGSRHPFWRRFHPDALNLMIALQRANDGGSHWSQIKWDMFRIDPYWIKANPKFAFPGPWCTEENGHTAEWSERPKC